MNINHYKNLQLNIIDVANYLITYLNNNHIPLNNIQLNIFIFNVYANVFINEKIILFTEEFSYGLYGPLNEKLYKELRTSYSYPIIKTIDKIIYPKDKPFDYKIIPYNESNISNRDKKIIAKYLELSLNALKYNDKKYETILLTDKNYRKVIKMIDFKKFIIC